MVTNNNMKEIPGHSGYFVTESGEVWSTHGRGANGELRQLKPQKTEKGYLKVMFRDKKRYSIHRLVCQTYLPNPNNLPQVNHIDEVKTNNNLSNLEWCDNYYNEVYSKAKHWKVECPDGELLEIYNLKAWCKATGVNQGNLTYRGHSKGYKLVD